MRLCSGLTLALSLILTIGSAGTGFAETAAAPIQPPSSGTPLSEALQALRDQGLNLVFSNALVKPQYQVPTLPDEGGPLESRARTLLAPFGLTLEKVPPDTWYVVGGDAAPAQTEAPLEAPVVRQAPVVEQVLVTSSRYRLVREIHEQQRLEQRELRAIPSLGRDLLRAINQLSGQASSGVTARNHFRGGNTDEVLYLVDGVEVIEPFHMGDFQALFSTVNPGLVNAIDVYTAGFPVSYGSRLSGVVDMEIQPARSALSGAVDINLISAAAQVQGYKDRVEWLVSARRSVVDMIMGGLENDYGKPRFHDELARVAWEGDRTSLAAGLLSSNDELSLTDVSAGENAKADYHNLATWVHAEYLPSDRLELSLVASFTRVKNERSGTLDDPLDAIGQLSEERKFTVITAKPTLRWRVNDRWLLHAGLEGQVQDGDFDVLLDARYGPLGEPLQAEDRLLRDIEAERDGTLLTGFLSLQQTIGGKLQLEYGIRYDLQDIDPVHDNQFSPRLQINYQATPSLDLFANLGRYTQHQNLYELQLDDGLLELSPPQIADQVSVGADWKPFESVELRVEAYRRNIDDPRPRFENIYNPWVLLPELHADRVALVPDKARASGIELTLWYRLTDELSGTLSYTHSTTEERLQGNWRTRPWDQHHAARLGLDWRPGQWRLGANAGWHSGWPNTSRLTEAPTSSRRLYDQQLPDYFSLDLHVARRFQLQRSELEVYLDLTNATLRENIGGYRYELNKGSIVSDERKLLPAIPALGIVWTW